MSRRQRVRGPRSALTSFLGEQGITLAARQQARERHESHIRNAQAEAANVDVEGDDEVEVTLTVAEPTTSATQMTTDANAEGGEDAEVVPATVRRSRRVPVAAAGSHKRKGKGKKGKHTLSDDDESGNVVMGSSSGAGQAGPSKKRNARGHMLVCEVCKCRFLLKNGADDQDGYGPDGRIMCPACARSARGTGGGSRKTQPKLPGGRPRRKAKKAEVGYEAQDGPHSLVDICIQVIGKYIHDVESLGDMSERNLDKICRIISKRRELTPESLQLFLRPDKTRLALYDTTRLPALNLTQVTFFCPFLTHLHLDFCGRLDDETLGHMGDKLTRLENLHLHGPFLITDAACERFLTLRGAQLRTLSLNQVPQFSTAGMRALRDTATRLTSLTLASCERVDDTCLQLLADPDHSVIGKGLTHLDISRPGAATAVGGVYNTYTLQDDTMLTLLARFGADLVTLDLSGCHTLTDRILHEGLLPHCGRLETLRLAECTALTAAGLARFLVAAKDDRPGSQAEGFYGHHLLRQVDLGRCADLEDIVVEALVYHSGPHLEEVNLNGLLNLTERAVAALAGAVPFDERWHWRFPKRCRKLEREHTQRLNAEPGPNLRVMEAAGQDLEAIAPQLGEHELDLDEDGNRRQPGPAGPGLFTVASFRTSHGATQDGGGVTLGSESELSESESEGSDQDDDEGPKGGDGQSTVVPSCPHLSFLDLSWARPVGNKQVAQLLRACPDLQTLVVWGCNRVTESAPTRRGFKYVGRESDTR
ncbi:UV-damaged DNA-binding protein rad7 [Tieghemiomyces parasiticus]|uniref:UV-damaged DNA-binding protein rad7 n=1 Tax=Tieghemiomyces parasiticus TaxID=78921 RepID=A0A9W8A864_9FUNG|nr:UV-damaged DNA-binding protein rad7 [Tieghemiomyces parasiticus]